MRKLHLSWRWLLAPALLVVAALFAHGAGAGAPGFDGYSRTDQGTTPPGPNFSGAVFIDDVQIKDNCDTLFDDFKCVVHPGETFTFRVYLDDTGPLPDNNTNTINGYTETNVRLDYSPNLTPKPGTLVTSMPCDAPQIDPDPSPRKFHWICPAPSAPGESTYESELFSVDFNCPAFKSKESITIVSGLEFDVGNQMFDTYIEDDAGVRHAEPNGSDTIIINCDNNFVWDVDDSGQVSVTDIFQVVQHFGQVKPTP